MMPLPKASPTLPRRHRLMRALHSGIVLALASYAFFSISDACSKGLAGRIDPFEVAFFGGVFGILLLPFVRQKGESYTEMFRTPHPWMWLLRAAAVFIATASSVAAFMLLPMPEALSLMFLMPFFVTIISVFALKESVSAITWLSVGIGFLGVLIVLRPGAHALHLGHLCAVISALTSGVSVIAYRFSGTNTSRLTLFAPSLIGPLVGNGVLMAVHAHFPHGWAEWSLLFGYGFLAALAQLFMMLATAVTPANRVALPQYSQMIWVVAFSYLIFHQPLDGWDIVGIIVVTSSGMVNWVCQKIRYEHMILREWWRRYRFGPPPPMNNP